MTDSRAPLGTGLGIIRLNVVGTAVFVLVTALASLWNTDRAAMANLIVSSVLFVGGCAAFGVGFLRAANRSRTEVLDLAGLFYLTGSAPSEIRRTLLGLWFVQIAVAVVSIFTLSPPFGVMAPVWGIGMLTVWGARHGDFPVRFERR